MSKIGIFMADGCEEIEGLTVVDIVRRAKMDITMISVNGKREVSVAFPRGRGGKLYLRRHSARTGERQRGLRAHLPAHGSQDAAVLRPLPRRR